MNNTNPSAIVTQRARGRAGQVRAYERTRSTPKFTKNGSEAKGLERFEKAGG
jgi:hypothetical protein